MKKLLLFIISVLCLSLGFVSCAHDDGNYDYLTEDEVGVITFDTVSSEMKAVWYQKFSPGQHINYTPNVKYKYPERLRYRWFVLRTYYNDYRAEQVGNEFVYPAADTIAYTKELDIDLDLTPGTYFLYCMAEDSVNGMKAYNNPTGSYITIKQDGYQGGLYLLTEKDGQTEIEIFISELMLIYGSLNCYYDYYSGLAGQRLPGKPRFIRGTTAGKNSKGAYLVATDEGVYRLNSTGLQLMDEWEDMFYDVPSTFNPQNSFFSTDNSMDAIINNGKLHVLYTSKTNDRKYSAPIAGDYEAADFLMKNTRNRWRAVTGAINAWQVIYDKKNHQFRPYYSQAAAVSNFKTTVDSAYVDANKLPSDPVAIFQCAGNQTFCILNDNGTPYLYRFNFYNRIDNGDLSAAGARSKVNLSGCTDILKAKRYASTAAGYAFYYATDNAVYSFSSSSGATTSNTLYTCEAGETVTSLYIWGSAGGGWPTYNCILWIAVWNENKQSGKLLQYEMDVDNGVPMSMWGPMFGAPDNPVITEGWGKIVDMTCVDAE